MPELPEVEVIARGLRQSISNRCISRVELLWPTSIMGSQDDFTRRLTGRHILDVGRRGKLLLLGLETGATLVVHLKMTGRLVHGPRKPALKHDRVRFHLDDGSLLTFADIRRFGYLAVFFPRELETWKFYNNLGPEPLEMTTESFVSCIRGRCAKIKSLLLDQKIIAGVGNIYADEALFRAGIRPGQKANKVPKKCVAALLNHLNNVLEQAIQENGSSIRDYRDSNGNAGSFQNSFQVYGRAGLPCKTCGKTIVKTVVSGRTSSYCPNCQQ